MTRSSPGYKYDARPLEAKHPAPAKSEHILPFANNLGGDGSSSRWRFLRSLCAVSVGVPIRRVNLNGILFFGLSCVWATSYILSLHGGDVVFINNNIGILGGELIVSVLALTLMVTMLYMRKLRKTTRRNVLVLIVVIATALYFRDHGERFDHHGFYNVLIFLVIFIPLNLVIAGLYMLFMTVPNFIVILGVSTIGLLCGVTVALRHYMYVFDQGMFGRLQDIPGECKWQGANYPLVDLLPPGTQNFWAGSMHCKSKDNTITASFDAEGYLTASCSTNGAIYVDILPDTRTWPLRAKSKWQVFNHVVLNKTVRADYKAPMAIEERIQAVVVRCGSASKIVTRVSPSLSRLADYVPPEDTDTRPLDLRRPITGRRPNVMFLFLDAVSHRQFYRRLKKTAKVLASLHRPGKSELTELYRHHSLGFSTDNSTKAMYIGSINPGRVNPLPIWAYFRDRGYVTARVETSCEDWARTYLGYYHRRKAYSVGKRSLDYELSSPFCMPEYYPAVGNSFGNFKGPFSITARCLYGRHVHEYGFDYIDQLRHELRSADASKRRPYLLMLNLMEGHEGTGEVLRTLDDRLSQFLADFRDSGEAEDTALFLLSDHGLHMGLNMAFLNSGKIEHKNPFFSMVLPAWLHEQLGDEGRQGLRLNEQRLTTAFETHYTLRTLASWPAHDQEDYARSLFTAVPAGRTCEEAGIGSNVCRCRS
ncbi:hypothetical protein GGI15_003183 [Coemansia interrupta]|uniref:DUF229 domain-containing protein n=1 Tax=Coemansia interrupta TaxID=1126814 RepID=A0A9W8HB30_9FUNG|nr:hypothetical protein GGI15_003183 [Coemansia interrupta]